MNLIDEEYTKHPFYGSPRLTAWLNRQGYIVNIKRIKRLMEIMGIQAIYPQRKTSIKDRSHHIYPYLLTDLVIRKANQVWSSDITYIRVKKGFMYLVAIMDWFSRYVLAWVLLENEIRISMDAKGRAFDNIFIERLWRSVKYENIYLNHYESVRELRAGLAHYFDFYNKERPHQSLDYSTPFEVHFNNN